MKSQLTILTLLLFLFLIQGCATTNPSEALRIYESHTGYRMSDVDPEDFVEGQTKPKPYIYGSQEMTIDGSYSDLVHRVFGTFPTEEEVDESLSSTEILYASYRASNLVLLEATYTALNDLGFEIVRAKEMKVGIMRTPLTVVKVANEQEGCPESGFCLVHVMAAAAHFRPKVTGSQTDRYITADGSSAHVVFLSGGDTTFDQRRFYQKLSERLPPKMYVYLAANSDSYVQVNNKERLVYPYLLNQGKILNFIRPEKSKSQQ